MTKAYEERMVKAVAHLESEYASVRAGRANPGILDKVTVDYYGVPTPINQVASVSVTEARTLSIQPWDRTLIKPITKAIQMADIGINPIDDGTSIRLNFPAPTEERRKVAVRNVRRDALDKFKAAKKASELTEDDLKNLEEKIQKITDKFIKEVDAVCEKKTKEVMEL